MLERRQVMEFLIRVGLWLTGVFLILLIAKFIGLGLGLGTQILIIFWMATVYSDARYHEFKFI